MRHFKQLTPLETALINEAVDTATLPPEDRQPLSGSLCSVHLNHTLSPWLMLCHQVYFEHRHQHKDGQHRGVAKTLSARKGALNVELFPAADIDAHRPTEVAGQTHLTPAFVAHLAEQAAAGQPEPADLQQALLVRTFLQGGLPPPDLSLRVLLVGQWVNHFGAGVPAWMDLWRVPEANQGTAQPLRVVRAPGSVLAPADASFEIGLLRVQALLRAVLRPDAPSLAFSLRPAQIPGQSDAAPLGPLEGPSASVTLALGALWLLQDHLREEHAELRDALQDLALERVVITAALGELPAPTIEGQTWPTVEPIGGIGHKRPLFDLLDEAEHEAGSTGLMMATAANQPGMPGPAATDAEPETLPAFIERLCRTAGSGLASPQARQLHRLLVQDDADITDTDLINTVRSQPRPASLKAWLVWRWAQRAGGPDAAFGTSPNRLAQRFTKLTLMHSADENQAPGVEKERPRTPYQLEQLLDDPEQASRAGWLIDAPPFAGKSTLLAWREMGAARRALQALRGAEPLTPFSTELPSRAVDHIEVCVVLPLREWTPREPKDEGLRQQFERFLFSSGPLQAFWPQPSGPGQAMQAPALLPWLRHPIRLRLCLDGLNEFSAASEGLRQQALHALCDSLALRQGLLLPPLFTVRERERSLLPSSPAHGGWRLQEAHVEAWTLDVCMKYIDQAGLTPEAAGQLKQFLQPAKADNTLPAWADPYAQFRSFCSTPGFLAAQCTLLRWRPGRAPATRRSDLFSALLWYALNQDLKPPADPALLPSHLRGEDALKAAEADGWRLKDRSMGLLVGQLLATAAAMVNKDGLPEYEVSEDRAAPGLPQHHPLRQDCLNAMRNLGLATLQAGRFAFVHQQWHEFLLALARERGADLPEDLAAPPLNPESKDLLAHLKQEGARLELPTVSPHHERLRFTAEFSGDPLAWVRRLLPVNLPLAARIAIDHLHQLEPDGPYPGDGRRGPNGVVQLLRHALLLRQSDAGARLKPRIRASGTLDVVEVPVLNLPADDPLQAWWAQQLREAFQPQEVDLRLRIEAGFLLGELGDNLRYELVTATAPEGDVRTGLRLKPALWAVFGKPGRKQRYVIGSARNDKEADDDEKPARSVRLGAFAMARLPVTVAEWRWFAKAGYDSADAPWWRLAGKDAQRWLPERHTWQGSSTWALQDAAFGRGAQPMVGLTAYEAQAYAHWSEPMYMAERAQDVSAPGVAQHWSIRVPAEGMWEAGVRGPAPWWAPWLRPAPRWPFQTEPVEQALLLFNHGYKILRTAPVASFAAGVTEQGVFDASGQISEWCANRRSGADYSTKAGLEAALSSWVDDVGEGPEQVALRGGAFSNTASECRVSCRLHYHPDSHEDDIGVRLVRVWPPHSEP